MVVDRTGIPSCTDNPEIHNFNGDFLLSAQSVLVAYFGWWSDNRTCLSH